MELQTKTGETANSRTAFRGGLLKLSLSLGLYWGWMGLCFFSTALFPYATDPIPNVELANLISLIFSTLATVIVAFISTAAAKRIESSRALFTATLVVGFLGTMMIAFSPQDGFLLSIGAVFVGLVEGFLLYLLCSKVAKTTNSGIEVAQVFTVALVFAAAVYFLAILLSGLIGIAICALSVLAIIFPQLSQSSKSESTKEAKGERASAAQKSSIWNGAKKLPWKLIVGLSVFGIGFGLMRISASTQELGLFQMSYVAHILSRTAIALIALIMVVWLKKAYWVLSTIGLLGFILGLCAFWIPWGYKAIIVVAATTAGFTCFELLLWLILFELYAETKLPFNSVYGSMRGLINIMMMLTTALLFFWGSRLPDTAIQMVSIILLLVLVLVSSLLFGSRDIASLWGIQKRGIKASEEKGAEVVDLLVGRYGLTPREAEVAALLMKGRSEPYIAETLFISPHTAHAHISHIYVKMEVHSRQELLDVIENDLEAFLPD